MNAARCIGPVIVVKCPPLACIAAFLNGRKAAEFGLVAARRNGVDHVRREQPLAVDFATVEHQLTQPPQIAQTGRDTAPRKIGTRLPSTVW